MAEDTMRAEQEPLKNADQQEPQGREESWLASAGESAGQNSSARPLTSSFQFATEAPGMDTNVNFTVAHPDSGRKGSGGGPVGGHIPSGGNESHWGRRIMLGAGALLASAGIGIGIDRAMNNGGDSDSDKGVAAAVTPAVEHTPPPTVTVETAPTPKVEKYPIELGKTIDFGNVDVNLTKDLMETGALLDVNTGVVRKEGLKVQDVILNPDVPGAEQRLNNAIMYGEFLAWQSEDSGRSGITFEQFKEKVVNNEDVSFSLYGFTSGDIIAEKGEFKVDPRKKVHIVLTSTPSPNIQPFGGSKFGFRTVNGELYLEMYDYQAFGAGDKVHADSDIDVSISWVLALMSERQVQKDEKLSQAEYSRVYANQQIFDKMLILKNSATYWSGSLNVR